MDSLSFVDELMAYSQKTPLQRYDYSGKAQATIPMTKVVLVEQL